MRTTIDLPEDLHRVVRSLALHTRRSLSVTAVELIRRGLVLPQTSGTGRNALKGVTLNAVTGLPLVHHRRVLTPEDVKALEDEA